MNVYNRGFWVDRNEEHHMWPVTEMCSSFATMRIDDKQRVSFNQISY